MKKQMGERLTSSFSMLRRGKRNSFSHADEKMMERILTKSPTHRSRSPKGVTKLPLAAEGVTRRWLTEVEKGSNTSQVCIREMNASESPFKVSKAQLARQNITFETCDGQAQRIFGLLVVRLPVQRRHESITGFSAERRRATGTIQRGKRNKGSVRMEDIWCKAEEKANLRSTCGSRTSP